MKGFYRLKDGETITITAHDGEVIDPIERYMTRHLRREIFRSLANQPIGVDHGYHMMMFGSGALQYHRPVQGFPIHRRARDIDLGIVRNTNRNEDISLEEQKQIDARISAAAINIGAQLTTDKYGGKIIQKIYSPEEVNSFLVDKNEKAYGTRENSITIELKVSRTQVKTPLLRPISIGKDFFIENPKEVLGTKLMRMVSPKDGGFEIKDVMDFYNALSAGIINTEKDAELLRGIALLFISTAAVEASFQPTLKNLEPTQENIENAMYIMGVDDETFMTTVFEKVHNAVKKIMGIERHSELPGRLAGSLKLSLNELNFNTKLRGVEWQPGARGNKTCPPAIEPDLLFSAKTLAEYPELLNGVRNKMELQRIVETSLRDISLRDF